MSPAVRRFVDYFGELGPRWGLPPQACRVHAYLFVLARPLSEEEIARALSLSAEQLDDALAYLADYRMADQVASSSWRTSADPWDMLLRGLEQRRRRELPSALATLRACQRDARAEPEAGRSTEMQIGKMLALVEDLAAIDGQAQRISPQVLRGLVGVSGRAARFVDRAFSPKGGRK